MPYEWLKAMHIIAVIAWMAGMLYLPRLYVYHVSAIKGGELSETLKIMERRLLRLIINPAMILTFLFGIGMIAANPSIMREPYMHVKMALVIAMVLVHALLARYRRHFAADANQHTARFYRILNEIPTMLMIGIVIAVVVKP